MAKAKSVGRPTQKHLHSRISFLYQASSYMQAATGLKQAEKLAHHGTPVPQKARGKDGAGAETEITSLHGEDRQKSVHGNEQQLSALNGVSLTTHAASISRQYLSQMRAVSLKAQIRLSPEAKRSICKRCDYLLTPGISSTERIENQSRGGRKPWADVLVTSCKACGTKKRFPIGKRRQKKRNLRTQEGQPEIPFPAEASVG